MALHVHLQLTVLGELDNEIHKRALRNEKHLCKLNSTVLQLDDIEFKKLFRVTRALLSQLLQDSSPHLKVSITRQEVPTELKVQIIH